MTCSTVGAIAPAETPQPCPSSTCAPAAPPLPPPPVWLSSHCLHIPEQDLGSKVTDLLLICTTLLFKMVV